MSLPRVYVYHLSTLTNVEKYNILSKRYQHMILDSIKIILMNRNKLWTSANGMSNSCCRHSPTKPSPGQLPWVSSQVRGWVSASCWVVSVAQSAGGSPATKYFKLMKQSNTPQGDRFSDIIFMYRYTLIWKLQVNCHFKCLMLYFTLSVKGHNLKKNYASLINLASKQLIFCNKKIAFGKK